MRFMTIPRGAAHQMLLVLLGLGAGSGAKAQSLDAFNPQPSTPPTTVTIQTDGRILLGGIFTDAITSSLISIQRLNVDGSADASLSDPGINDEIKTIAVQPDGKILIGGTFDMIGTAAHHYLARLNANGSLDASFVDPQLDNTVWAIAVQPDGKVLVAGDFLNAGTTARAYLARFSATGTLDSGFANPQLSAPARAVVLQASGSVLVGGYFLGTVTNNTIGALARFTSAGVLDATFPVNPSSTNVNTVVVAPDGSIYVGTSYNTTDQTSQRPVAKLSVNGILDTSYADIHIDSGTSAIALQPDGKVVVGGIFQVVDGHARHALARLNVNGTLDTSFADMQFSFDVADPNGYVHGLAAQTNGATIAVGNFTLANGVARKYAARVVTADAAISKLTGVASGANVIATWTRTGAGPELAQAPTLMHSNDGVNYTAVAPMTRIANGWQITAAYNVAGAPFYLQAVGNTSNGAGSASPGRTASPVYVSDRIFADGFE